MNNSKRQQQKTFVMRVPSCVLNEIDRIAEETFQSRSVVVRAALVRLAANTGILK